MIQWNQVTWTKFWNNLQISMQILWKVEKSKILKLTNKSKSFSWKKPFHKGLTFTCTKLSSINWRKTSNKFLIALCFGPLQTLGMPNTPTLHWTLFPPKVFQVLTIQTKVMPLKLLFSKTTKTISWRNLNFWSRMESFRNKFGSNSKRIFETILRFWVVCKGFVLMVAKIHTDRVKSHILILRSRYLHWEAFHLSSMLNWMHSVRSVKTIRCAFLRTLWFIKLRKMWKHLDIRHFVTLERVKSNVR